MAKSAFDIALEAWRKTRSPRFAAIVDAMSAKEPVREVLGGSGKKVGLAKWHALADEGDWRDMPRPIATPTTSTSPQAFERVNKLAGPGRGRGGGAEHRGHLAQVLAGGACRPRGFARSASARRHDLGPVVGLDVDDRAMHDGPGNEVVRSFDGVDLRVRMLREVHVFFDRGRAADAFFARCGRSDAMVGSEGEHARELVSLDEVMLRLVAVIADEAELPRCDDAVCLHDDAGRKDPRSRTRDGRGALRQRGGDGR